MLMYIKYDIDLCVCVIEARYEICFAFVRYAEKKLKPFIHSGCGLVFKTSGIKRRFDL